MLIKAILVNDTRAEMHVGCISVINNITDLLASWGIEIIYYHPVTKRWDESDDFLSAFNEADVVILNAEGSIHSSNGRAIVLSELGSFCKENNKKSVILNGTYYNNNDLVYKNISCFDLVYSRDMYSLNNLTKKGVDAKFSPDMTFYKNLGAIGKERNQTSFFTTDSVFSDISSKLENFCSDKNVNWFPMTNSGLSLESYISTLADASVVITGRFHAVCFCLNIGVPFAFLESNTPKISFLMKDVFGDKYLKKRVLNEVDVIGIAIDALPAFDKHENECIISYKKRAFFQFRELGKNIHDLSVS
ncbi:polysaccharide pyruvyl transferase [Kushneria sinocarnis]|uniref:Polysaccharide pyruvyl transferase n=1 Tax=Kushneria sinocarnis TaxID=595502 RepID=A0A420WWZ4_9GAMM|nr:polysaccharide pyruvyl transferase family protein [Kushneria sinocarnis]RKR04250.1 polysaccharide pyruvyl transferase [Kushneria sinocarnis]